MALGADMFDCVWPTRTAVGFVKFSIGDTRTDFNQRFGDAIVSSGTINLRRKHFAQDFRPVEEGCTCTCCRPVDQGGLGLTRAYMHHITAKETVGAHLYALISPIFLCCC